MRNTITIKEAEGKELERRVKAKTVAVRERQRAQIVVLAVRGMKQGQIAAEVGVSRVTVNHWCRRFMTEGLDGLGDAKGTWAQGQFAHG